jgi:signal peptidase II
MLRGEVVDWIQLPNWPIFNIADSAVVCAAVLVTILSIKNIEFYGPTKNNEMLND